MPDLLFLLDRHTKKKSLTGGSEALEASEFIPKNCMVPNKSTLGTTTKNVEAAIKGLDVKQIMVLNTENPAREHLFLYYVSGETMPHETDQAAPAS